MSEMENQLEECGVCHALHPLEELRSFDDTLICTDCLEDSTVICGRCGERMWRDDDAGNEDSGHLCQSCYDRYYNTCEECHRIICEEDAYYEDDDRVLCYDCHRRHRSRYSINDYSYKPDPIFYGGGPLYMGVELEIDEGGGSDNQARKLLEIANGESERIYCKHDGSLNDGFEIVSHPMTLAYHMEKMPWKAVMDKARQMDYRSHQARTAGLHIHVNRSALGDNIVEQKEGIAIAKANGVYRGRPPTACPDFDRVVILWQSGEITAQEAARRLGISPSTFYRKLKGGKSSHE